MIATLYNAFAIIFRICFLDTEDRAATSTWSPWFAIDYLLDFVFYADIYLRAFHFAYIEDGDFVDDPEYIWQNYRNGDFLLHAFAALPLYYYGVAWGQVEIMSYLRLPRLLRMVDFYGFGYGHGYGEIFTQTLTSRRLSGLIPVYRLFDLMLLLFLASHICGCVFYALSKIQYPNFDSWVEQDGILGASQLNAGADTAAAAAAAALHTNHRRTHTDEPIEYQYARSLYWALGTLTVVCYGDIVAHSPAETMWVIVVCVIGFFLVGNVIGSMATLIQNMDREAAQHQRKLDHFFIFSTAQDLPTRLQNRVLQYYDYHFEHTRGMDEVEILKGLPTSLRRHIVMHLRGKYLKRLTCFQGLHTSLLQSVSTVARPQLFLPNDFIVKYHEIGNELHVIKDGRAQVTSAHGSVKYAALTEGCLCGEVAFFVREQKRVGLFDISFFGGAASRIPHSPICFVAISISNANTISLLN